MGMSFHSSSASSWHALRLSHHVNMCLHHQLHAMPCICRQTRLAAVALYNALTTGCGSQTLGEEYCNMLQVDGGECCKLRFGAQ